MESKYVSEFRFINTKKQKLIKRLLREKKIFVFFMLLLFWRSNSDFKVHFAMLFESVSSTLVYFGGIVSQFWLEENILLLWPLK